MAEITRLPGTNTEAWDWQLHGSCRGMNSEFFFHSDAERGRARDFREARAKAICRTCPVLVRCREHALNVQEAYGIWGGLGENERREIIARRRHQERALRAS
ncbi:MAG: WhiB family transcriptional regulator [Sciscionella sp.]